MRLSLPEIDAALLREAAVLLAAVGLPLWLGGATSGARTALFALGMVAFAAALADAIRRRGRLPFGLGLVALALQLVLSVLQLIPLPRTLLASLSPAAADLLAFTLGPEHGARPLSLDPGQGWQLVLQLAGLTALWIGAADVARHGGRRRLQLALGLLGAALSVLGLLHVAFGLNEFLGVAGWSRLGMPGPFVNRNNLASLLALGAFALAGLALRTREVRGTLFGGLGAALALGGVAATQSRAGIAAAVLGVGLFALSLRAEGGATTRQVRALILGLAGLAGLVGWLTVDAERWTALLESSDGLGREAKVELWASVPSLIEAHPWFGIGRGAFATVFPRFQQHDPQVTFSHPENALLQLTSELGLPFGLLLALLLSGAVLRGLLRKDRSAAESGLAVGLAVVGLHDLADLGLEVAGLAAPVVVALAALELRPEAAGRIRRPVGIALFLLVGLAGAQALLQADGRLERDRERTAALATTRDLAAAEVALAGHRERHPADPVAPLVGGLVALEAGRPERALFWANQAQYLAPLNPWGHRIAARALVALGNRPQARLELRAALDEGLRDLSFAPELWAAASTPEEVLELEPTHPERASALLDRMPGTALALGYGRLFIEENGAEDSGLLLRLALWARTAGQNEEALAWATRATELAPRSVDAHRQRAEALLALGRGTEGAAALERCLELSPAHAPTTARLASLLTSQGRALDALVALERARPTSTAERVELLDQVARAEATLGRLQAASRALRDAADLDRAHPARRLELARWQLSNGFGTEAAASLREALPRLEGEPRREAEALLQQLTSPVARDPIDAAVRGRP